MRSRAMQAPQRRGSVVGHVRHVGDGGGRFRRTGRSRGLACVEPLEARALLSSIAIPALIYHRTEVTKTNPDGSSWFEDQIALLHEKSYDSISIEEYRVWHDGGSLPAGVDHPFIAIFDDGTRDLLEVDGDPLKGAAAVMSKYGTAKRPFRGVTAVPTAQVGIGDRLTWEQLRTLTNPIDGTGDGKGFGWEIASHSRNHLWMGDGHPKKYLPPEKFANNVAGGDPGSLGYELVGSKRDILEHSLGREEMAFVWPGDDMTTRSLAEAARMYDVVFGGSSDIGATTERFIGRSSGLQNGELYRIGIRGIGVGGPMTTLESFGQMLDRCAALTDGAKPFTPTVVEYPTQYKARDGTIVIDGTVNADSITLNDTSFVLNGVTYDQAALKPDYEGRGEPFAVYNVDGRGGNDVIVGTTFADSIYGGDGDDTIRGGFGDDTLSGGAQRDHLDGGIGADRLNGNGGNDKLFGGPGGDRLFGYDGNDLLDGGSSTDRLEGGRGIDTMYGVGGDDRFFAAGDSSADVLFGGTGANTAVVDLIDLLTDVSAVGRPSTSS